MEVFRKLFFCEHLEDQSAENATLRKQIAELEREIQNLKNGAITTDHISIRSLKILDDENNTRGQMSFNKDGSIWLSFFDDEGVTRLKAGITHNGISRIRMHDENEATRWPSSTTRTDAAQPVYGTTIYSGEERPLLLYTVGATETPYMSLLDKKGIVRLDMGINQDSWAYQSLYDKSGNMRFQTNTSPNNRVNLIMENTNGKTRTWMLNQENGLSALYSKDNSGRSRIVYGLTTDSDSFIETWGVDGSTKMSVITGADGSFKNYVYKTPGERAWNATSNIATGIGLLQLLIGSDK